MFRAQSGIYVVTFRYSGWLLFCPVVLSGLTDPEVHPRWGWLDPVLSVALWLDASLCRLKTLIDPENEAGWTFRGVRPLAQPYSVRCER